MVKCLSWWFHGRDIPKVQNEEANQPAQTTSGYRPRENILFEDLVADDWRKEIMDYLKDPSQRVSIKIWYKALKYVLLDEDLYYRTIDGVLLQCLSDEEARSIMDEVHKILVVLINRLNKKVSDCAQCIVFWPTMLEDCFQYYRGCRECQRFGDVQRPPGIGHESDNKALSIPWLGKSTWSAGFIHHLIQ